MRPAALLFECSFKMRIGRKRCSGMTRRIAHNIAVHVYTMYICITLRPKYYRTDHKIIRHPLNVPKFQGRACHHDTMSCDSSTPTWRTCSRRRRRAYAGCSCQARRRYWLRRLYSGRERFSLGPRLCSVAFGCRLEELCLKTCACTPPASPPRQVSQNLHPTFLGILDRFEARAS